MNPAAGNRIILKYMLGGAAFGCLFPVGAWILDAAIHQSQGTPANLWQLHLMNPLHEQLREGVKHLQLQHHGQGLGTVTLSLGVAGFPDHGMTGEAVLGAADAALYRAKRNGRDQVVVAQ